MRTQYVICAFIFLTACSSMNKMKFLEPQDQYPITPFLVNEKYRNYYIIDTISIDTPIVIKTIGHHKMIMPYRVFEKLNCSEKQLFANVDAYFIETNPPSGDFRYYQSQYVNNEALLCYTLEFETYTKELSPVKLSQYSYSPITFCEINKHDSYMDLLQRIPLNRNQSKSIHIAFEFKEGYNPDTFIIVLVSKRLYFSNYFGVDGIAYPNLKCSDTDYIRLAIPAYYK